MCEKLYKQSSPKQISSHNISLSIAPFPTILLLPLLLLPPPLSQTGGDRYNFGRPSHATEFKSLLLQVVTVAKFQGGGAFNVIPDSVTIGGTFRAFSKTSFFQLKQRIEEVIVAQASVQRCGATVNFFEKERPFFPVTVNSETIHAHFKNVAGGMLGPDNVRYRHPVMGAEDFAFFTEVVPSTFYYFLGMQNASGELRTPGHSPYFTINEAVLPYGAALHASLAMQYLLVNASDTRSQSEARGSHDEL